MFCVTERTGRSSVGPRRAKRASQAAVIAALLIPLVLGGCMTNSRGLTATHGAAPTSPTLSEVQRTSRRYQRNPTAPANILAFAEALRANDQTRQAVEVLRQGLLNNRGNQEIAGAYGKALAANGQMEQALNVLREAQRPDLPDWRLMSAEGAILDQQGKHADARILYEDALKLNPNSATILNNFGLSYALTGDLQQAEAYLRRAVAAPDATPKVRQNLSLVLGLQGEYDAAAAVVGGPAAGGA